MGQAAIPNSTLLNVRGFDPVANQFLYTVNPLFGSLSANRTAYRPPFRLTIDFRLDVGPDRETEAIKLHLVSAPGSTLPPPPTDEEGLRQLLLREEARLSGGTFRKELAAIVSVVDSVHLTRMQAYHDRRASASTLRGCTRFYLRRPGQVPRVAQRRLRWRGGSHALAHGDCRVAEREVRSGRTGATPAHLCAVRGVTGNEADDGLRVFARLSGAAAPRTAADYPVGALLATAAQVRILMRLRRHYWSSLESPATL